MSRLDFYLHQAGMWQQSTPLLMLEQCQRKPAKSECLEKNPVSEHNTQNVQVSNEHHSSYQEPGISQTE